MNIYPFTQRPQRSNPASYPTSLSNEMDSMGNMYSLQKFYKSMDQALQMIEDAVRGEKYDEMFYTYLIEEAPNQEQKRIIISIKEDEMKHNKMFRQIFKELTGIELKNSMDVQFVKPASYIGGIKKAIFGELQAMEKYRDIRAGMPSRCYRDMLFEIITDELQHASKYNYILSQLSNMQMTAPQPIMMQPSMMQPGTTQANTQPIGTAGPGPSPAVTLEPERPPIGTAGPGPSPAVTLEPERPPIGTVGPGPSPAVTLEPETPPIGTAGPGIGTTEFGMGTTVQETTAPGVAGGLGSGGTATGTGTTGFGTGTAEPGATGAAATGGFGTGIEAGAGTTRFDKTQSRTTRFKKMWY